MSTRGIKVLEQRGVSFELVEYIYKQKGAGRAALAVGWDEAQVVKTLVMRAGERALYFVLVPASSELSTKNLARLLEVKSVELCSVRDAERLTGYVEGGISPFGSFTALPVIMEESLFEHERILINGGRRGVLVALSPWDTQELLDAKIALIVA